MHFGGGSYVGGASKKALQRGGQMPMLAIWRRGTDVIALHMSEGEARRGSHESSMGQRASREAPALRSLHKGSWRTRDMGAPSGFQPIVRFGLGFGRGGCDGPTQQLSVAFECAGADPGLPGNPAERKTRGLAERSSGWTPTAGEPGESCQDGPVLPPQLPREAMATRLCQLFGAGHRGRGIAELETRRETGGAAGLGGVTGRNFHLAVCFRGCIAANGHREKESQHPSTSDPTKASGHASSRQSPTRGERTTPSTRPEARASNLHPGQGGNLISKQRG
ncbi:Protein C08B6.4, isoform b [Marssonina coronariae]|uniref:Protein C08B6.4, isoform b n=1 Tax=Diplocarpon coronariae TaxID=2795749 RepID=A0A218ZAF3_9HELO|nr:Protein C08B6.4, isoform b [Marssonina coronariae]